MHVIFGAGQAGKAVATALSGDGERVRLVSRTGKAPPQIEGISADVADKDAALAAARGATTIYCCLGAPYTNWPRLLPALQANVLAAARATTARLVVLENLYAYGPVPAGRVHEALPLAAMGSKGRTRAMMTQELLAAHAAGEVAVTIGRASDFWGPGISESALGAQAAGAVAAGRTAIVMGDPEAPHSYTYMPDLARHLVTLGRHDDALGRAWHVPNLPAIAPRTLLASLAQAAGQPLKLRVIGRRTLGVMALASPLLREFRETIHQFAAPWLVDDSEFRATFPVTLTPLDESLAATAAWNASAIR